MIDKKNSITNLRKIDGGNDTGMTVDANPGSVKWRILMIVSLVAAGCGETVNPPEGSRFCLGGPCPDQNGQAPDAGTGGLDGGSGGKAGAGGMGGYAGEGGYAGTSGGGGYAGAAGFGGTGGIDGGVGGTGGPGGTGGVDGGVGGTGAPGGTGGVDGGVGGTGAPGGTGGVDGGVGGTGGTGGTDAGLQCSPFETECYGECVNTLTDIENCGDCGVICHDFIENSICVNGNCGCYPNAGLWNCDGICVQFLEDEQNCGGCDVKCSMDETCINGNCI